MIRNGKYTKGGVTLDVYKEGPHTVLRVNNTVFRFNENGYTFDGEEPAPATASAPPGKGAAPAK